jgi:hypothetical protein
MRSARLVLNTSTHYVVCNTRLRRDAGLIPKLCHITRETYIHLIHLASFLTLISPWNSIIHLETHDALQFAMNKVEENLRPQGVSYRSHNNGPVFRVEFLNNCMTNDYGCRCIDLANKPKRHSYSMISHNFAN